MVQAAVLLTALWRQEVLPSWASFAAAPFVWAGYWFTGHGHRWGWWFLIVSQASLVVIALTKHEKGLLLIVVPAVGLAFWNTRRGRRPRRAEA